MALPAVLRKIIGTICSRRSPALHPCPSCKPCLKRSKSTSWRPPEYRAKRIAHKQSRRLDQGSFQDVGGIILFGSIVWDGIVFGPVDREPCVVGDVSCEKLAIEDCAAPISGARCDQRTGVGARCAN
eukprot:5385300-Pyramimonas_sp.AAC.1